MQRLIKEVPITQDASQVLTFHDAITVEPICVFSVGSKASLCAVVEPCSGYVCKLNVYTVQSGQNMNANYSQFLGFYNIGTKAFHVFHGPLIAQGLKE